MEQDSTLMITPLITQNDKDLLGRITDLYGGASMSATVRRLIRDEAHRLHLANGHNGDRQPADQPAPSPG